LGLIDTELNDRYIGFRKHVAKHRPCAVVQSPSALVHMSLAPEQFADASSQIRRPGRRILKLEQFARKAAKVMYGVWL
jgi:hypothetical protein